jgi:hypothetical protein
MLEALIAERLEFYDFSEKENKHIITDPVALRVLELRDLQLRSG